MDTSTISKDNKRKRPSPPPTSSNIVTRSSSRKLSNSSVESEPIINTDIKTSNSSKPIPRVRLIVSKPKPKKQSQETESSKKSTLKSHTKNLSANGMSNKKVDSSIPSLSSNKSSIPNKKNSLRLRNGMSVSEESKETLESPISINTCDPQDNFKQENKVTNPNSDNVTPVLNFDEDDLMLYSDQESSDIEDFSDFEEDDDSAGTSQFPGKSTNKRTKVEHLSFMPMASSQDLYQIGHSQGSNGGDYHDDDVSSLISNSDEEDDDDDEMPHFHYEPRNLDKEDDSFFFDNLEEDSNVPSIPNFSISLSNETGNNNKDNNNNYNNMESMTRDESPLPQDYYSFSDSVDSLASSPRDFDDIMSLQEPLSFSTGEDELESDLPLVPPFSMLESKPKSLPKVQLYSPQISLLQGPKNSTASQEFKFKEEEEATGSQQKIKEEGEKETTTDNGNEEPQDEQDQRQPSPLVDSLKEQQTKDSLLESTDGSSKSLETEINFKLSGSTFRERSNSFSTMINRKSFKQLARALAKRPQLVDALNATLNGSSSSKSHSEFNESIPKDGLIESSIDEFFNLVDETMLQGSTTTTPKGSLSSSSSSPKILEGNKRSASAEWRETYSKVPLCGYRDRNQTIKIPSNTPLNATKVLAALASISSEHEKLVASTTSNTTKVPSGSTTTTSINNALSAPTPTVAVESATTLASSLSSSVSKSNTLQESTTTSSLVSSPSPDLSSSLSSLATLQSQTSKSIASSTTSGSTSMKSSSANSNNEDSTSEFLLEITNSALGYYQQAVVAAAGLNRRSLYSGKGREMIAGGVAPSLSTW